MPPELVVPLAAFVLGCLARLVVGGRAGPEERARRFIDARIEAHIHTLAAQHRRVSPGDPDDLPPGFANAIQSFIAEVLLRDAVAATGDAAVARAIRELVVLERGYIYGRIMRRIQDLTPPL